MNRLGFGDIVKKAFYLGVGAAAYAGEQAGKLGELRSQAQKLADELVAKGEMTTEEAKRFVEDMVKQAQQPASKSAEHTSPAEPRRIEILSDDEEPSEPSTSESSDQDVEKLKNQVQGLQEELQKLKRKQ